MDRNDSRVLVVDDEKDILDILQRILDAEGYEVVTAESGNEAIERVKTDLSVGKQFDLILIDWVMPQMDGMGVLRTVKQLDPDICAMIMTGYGSVNTAVRSMKLEAHDFITKPFRRITIGIRLEAALRKHRLDLENKRLLVEQVEERDRELDELKKEMKRLRTTH